MSTLLTRFWINCKVILKQEVDGKPVISQAPKYVRIAETLQTDNTKHNTAMAHKIGSGGIKKPKLNILKTDSEFAST